MSKPSLLGALLVSGALALGLLGGGCSQQARFVTEIPWGLTGDWLVVDTHSHTQFSDGVSSVDELAGRATAGGCDALAITDHSDLSTQSATAAYFAAIREARSKHPGLIIFGGLEWNIPPYKGREHVTVLVDPQIEEPVLSEFKRRFEAPGATAEAGLEWLRTRVPQPGDAVLVYNHPGRKIRSPGDAGKDLERWRSASPQMIGFEGGPGHQRLAEPGDYRLPVLTIDRWDPLAAEVGGVWDSQLDRGQSIWAALAVSDYHSDEMDLDPCEFSRTHVQVPERSASGILRALHAGSFWADQGQLLRTLNLTVSVESLATPLSPGEAAQVSTGQPVAVSVYLQRSSGGSDSPLTVELIGNGAKGSPELMESRVLGPQSSDASWQFRRLTPGADGKSAYFRVRVRKIVAGGPDLVVYSNPIRLFLY